MFATYAYWPYDASPELARAMHTIRLFLRRDQPYLHNSVYYASLSLAVGGVGDDPQGTVATALRGAPGSAELCSVLASPLGQLALTALEIDFPGPMFRLLFEMLPPAAQLVCAERQRNALGVGALVAGVGLILYALSGRKAA